MRRFLTVIFIFLLLTAAVLYLLTHWSFSDGSRAGTISKLSHRGYVFKTWEGVLNEGGYSGETGTLTPRYWEFSVLEIDSVNAKLREAMKTGERVTLKYEERVLKFPWNGDTKYFITDVEFLNPRKPSTPVQQLLHPQEKQTSDTIKVDTSQL